jgi:hypothetical protein
MTYGAQCDPQVKLIMRKTSPLAWGLAAVLMMTGSRSGASVQASRVAVVQYPVRKTRQRGLILDPVLVQVVRRHFPGFHLPAAEAMACTGDFDGNGLPDAALELTNRRKGLPNRRARSLLVAFHQIAPGVFRPYVLETGGDPSLNTNEDEDRPDTFNDYSIEHKPRGARLIYDIPHTRGDEGEMRLKHDGIAEYYGESEQVYYFSKGRYHYVDIAEYDDLEPATSNNTGKKGNAQR